MITYGTKEKYAAKTWLMGGSVRVSDIPDAVGFTGIQYNQNEFTAKSYYCALYKCFTLYSVFTGLVIPKDWRYEALQRCLMTPSPRNPKAAVIVDGIGGYLDEVVDIFREYISEKTAIKYVTMMIKMTSTDIQELQRKRYVIGTGFRTTAVFNKDKDDNGIVDHIDSVDDDGDGGHALCDRLDIEKHMRIDNYHTVNRYNIYQIIPYEDFISNTKMHFKYGFILTTLSDEKMTQAQQDANDFAAAVENKIVLKPENKGDKATVEQVAIMIMRAIKYILAKIGK